MALELRKIETKEAKQKKDRKKTFIGIFIGVIMLASSIAFAMTSNYESKQETKYKDYVFTKEGSYWQTTTGGSVIKTQFLPQDVESISLKGYVNKNDFSNKAVYVIAKTEQEKSAVYEFSQYISPLRMQLACVPGDTNELCKDLPEKTCETLQSGEALITVQDTTKTTNETSVNYKTNCLDIQGNEENLVKAADRTIFAMFGIIG